MKALVTGSTGFIGQHLVKQLLAEKWEVRCLARSTSFKPLEFLDDVEWMIGELSDFHALETACKNIDVIFHLAGATKAKNSKSFFEINYLGTENLLEAMTQTGKKTAQFILISSQAAGGPANDPDHPKTEDDPCYPVSAYGQSKLAAEIAVLKRKHHLRSAIVRPAIVYGPGDQETRLFFKLAKAHINPKIGREKHFISLIYIDDLVRLLIDIANAKPASGEIFIATDNENGHLFQDVIRTAKTALRTWTLPVFIPLWCLKIAAGIADLWRRLSGRTMMFTPDKYREIARPFWICSAAKAKEKLNFEPKHDLASGFEITARWYLDNGWLK